MIEHMPQSENNPEEQKEHLAPFRREEERRLEGIDAQEKLESIIQFSDDSKAKNPRDVVEAAKDYLEKMGGLDAKGMERLSELIKRAEEKLNEDRINSARKTMENIKILTKIHYSRKSNRWPRLAR